MRWKLKNFMFNPLEHVDQFSARPRESGDPEPQRLDSRLRGNERMWIGMRTHHAAIRMPAMKAVISAVISAGFSRCGTCPHSGRITAFDPGINFCQAKAYSRGNSRSLAPHISKVGTP